MGWGARINRAVRPDRAKDLPNTQAGARTRRALKGLLAAAHQQAAGGD